MANTIGAVALPNNVSENAAQTQSAAKAQMSSQKPATAQKPAAANSPTDTVQISTSAKAILQEATETKAQTAQEAQKGDAQAQRLLAKEGTPKTSK
ncbi:MAG TPA: hypothetical protein VFE02_06430 [Candidatus Acidoferrales bacterium]|jgi:hypothetical protein|nr:hypothetical protein [Candidatus Acidoferrales bacterium]